jgi:hypothetical protein
MRKAATVQYDQLDRKESQDYVCEWLPIEAARGGLIHERTLQRSVVSHVLHAGTVKVTLELHLCHSPRTCHGCYNVPNNRYNLWRIQEYNSFRRLGIVPLRHFEPWL